MAKKRGGIAGVWDRNKGVIKKVAPIAAGFIPGVGPLIGAGLGAAMGGLDRPGKGGIGLDVLGAVKGGVQGYGGAKLGQAAKGGIAKMFTAGKSPLDQLTGAPQVGLTPGGPTSYGAIGSYQPTLAGAPSAVSAASTLGLSAPSYGAMGSYQPSFNIPDLPDVTGIGSKYVTPMPAPMSARMSTSMPTAASAPPLDIPMLEKKDRFGSLGDLFGKEGKIEQNKMLLSGIGKGIMGTRSQDIEAQIAEENRLQREMELAQRKYEFEKTFGIESAQEADRKRREEQLQAQRAAFRSMFTGGA